jgi:hypothetical protein
VQSSETETTIKKRRQRPSPFTEHAVVESFQRETQIERAWQDAIMTTEIPQKLWPAFCDKLKEWYRGAVSIRWIQPDGTERDLIQDLPLQAFFLQKQNQCNNVVTIEAALPNERPLQHQIIEPFRIVLRKNDESGRYKQLEILAETGKTEVAFNPGIDSSLLEKLAA